ncbi:Rieske (2Fe-2S) protein [Jatrophihabitans sp. DSM 45814]
MPSNWVPVCQRSSLAAGEMALEDANGEEVVLAEVDGEVFAFAAICTHALGYLDQGELEGHEVLCPLHEGRFDIRTGKVISGEPEEPIDVYPTKIDGDTVYVEIND